MSDPTTTNLKAYLEEYAKACECNEFCHCSRVLDDIVSYLESCGVSVCHDEKTSEVA